MQLNSPESSSFPEEPGTCPIPKRREGTFSGLAVEDDKEHPQTLEDDSEHPQTISLDMDAPPADIEYPATIGVEEEMERKMDLEYKAEREAIPKAEEKEDERPVRRAPKRKSNSRRLDSLLEKKVE